jgi:hypothetical protein
VEELLDEDHPNSDNNHTEGSNRSLNSEDSGDDHTDDEDEDDDPYQDMTSAELLQRTLQIMKSAVEMQLDATSMTDQFSPLEQAMLQDRGMVSQERIAASAARETAEEYAAVWDVFQSSLIDLYITPYERRYAVAWMAAELCNFDNDTRQQMLWITNSVERLRLVCACASRAVSMMSARRLATSVTDTTDETSKDLSVGVPMLPPWAKSIRKGTAIEYYWNEEYEWCRGTVVEDPLRIVPDEIVLTIYFPDDDSTHRLPFSADEKARWRPTR